MFKDNPQAAVEIRDHRQFVVRRQLRQDFSHLGVELPNTGFREMGIGRFEEGIAVEWIDLHPDPIEQTINQITPPPLVVILARLTRGGTERHFAPNLSETAIERVRVKPQALPLRDKGVMLTHGFR